MLQNELTSKEQDLINSQEETKEYESLIKEEEENYCRIAAENKKKLEDM